jgi:hypothetical protein
MNIDNTQLLKSIATIEAITRELKCPNLYCRKGWVEDWCGDMDLGQTLCPQCNPNGDR